MFHSFNLSNETSASMPIGAFSAIKEAVLGEMYKLNIIIVSAERIKKLNTIYRDKTEPTDILSFPVSKHEGEIYLCPSEVRKEAKKFERSYANFLQFLLIHGCVHLKGYDHGATMERLEAKFRKRFAI